MSEMEYPDREDFVVVKVTQILDYGVFVELLEYKNIRGFVHISNVSSSWVKNIRNFVKPNQVRVAKVLNVDLQKKQIDLSFAGVTPQRERQKMTEFKQVNREEKVIQLLAKQEDKKFDEVWAEVALPLIEEYDSLNKAFEKISLGEDLGKIIDKKWIGPVKELVEKNFVLTKKIVRGTAKVQTISPTGIDDIKNLFALIEKKGCTTSYQGAGTYLILSESVSFKEAEKKLDNTIEEAETFAKKKNIKFTFEKVEE